MHRFWLLLVFLFSIDFFIYRIMITVNELKNYSFGHWHILLCFAIIVSFCWLFENGPFLPNNDYWLIYTLGIEIVTCFWFFLFLKHFKLNSIARCELYWTPFHFPFSLYNLLLLGIIVIFRALQENTIFIVCMLCLYYLFIFYCTFHNIR